MQGDKNTRKLEFSDYIIYVDESGTPNIGSHKEKYPVFVLTFVIVSKESYRKFIVPRVQDLKFKFFGHDMVNLHAYEIRQKENDFTLLMDSEKNNAFMDTLNQIMSEAYYVLISCVIKKEDFSRKGRDPYHMALQYCLERAHDFLISKNQGSKLTHIIAEGRGKKEDGLLSEEFHKILKNEYDYHQKHKRPYRKTPMELKFAAKNNNSTGLQMADLVGHPIGSKIAFPRKSNRAYEEIEGKFFRKGGRVIGLKIFP